MQMDQEHCMTLAQAAVKETGDTRFAPTKG